MNYYKLETVKEVLRSRYEATCVSASGARKEAWGRVAHGHTYRVLLAWDRHEEIVSEAEVRYIADGLRIDRDALIAEIRARGGLWLGPRPS